MEILPSAGERVFFFFFLPRSAHIGKRHIRNNKTNLLPYIALNLLFCWWCCFVALTFRPPCGGWGARGVKICTNKSNTPSHLWKKYRLKPLWLV